MTELFKLLSLSLVFIFNNDWSRIKIEGDRFRWTFTPVSTNSKFFDFSRFWPSFTPSLCFTDGQKLCRYLLSCFCDKVHEIMDQKALCFRLYKGDWKTLASSSTCSTDPMNVIIKCKRHLIIDNDINIFDIETTGGNVSGDHNVACIHLLTTFRNHIVLGWYLESCVDLVSSSLGFVSSECPCFVTNGSIQLSIIQHQGLKLVDVLLVEAKDENLFHYSIVFSNFFQQGFQSWKFTSEIAYDLNFLGDICVCCSSSFSKIFVVIFTNFNVHGIFGDVSGGNSLNLPWPSCTKHEGLSLFALGLTENMIDISFEAHVKHSICFVKTQEWARFHISIFTFHQIHESTRGCYHDLNTISKLLNLVVFWNSTINGYAFHSARFCKFLGLLFNLNGKLSGRCKN